MAFYAEQGVSGFFTCGKYRDPTPLLDHCPRIKKLCYTIANIERFVFG